jgi:predicted protein tyrosine phosphatase
MVKQRHSVQFMRNMHSADSLLIHSFTSIGRRKKIALKIAAKIASVLDLEFLIEFLIASSIKKLNKLFTI